MKKYTSFEEMYIDNRRLVYAFVLEYVKNPDEADDIVSALWLKIFQKEKNFLKVNRKTVQEYLKTEAETIALDYLSVKQCGRKKSGELYKGSILFPDEKDDTGEDSVKAEGKDAEIPSEPDEKLIVLAKKADDEVTLTAGKMKSARIMRVVAVIVICVVGITALGMTASEAFRQRVTGLFYDDESGSVRIETEEEKTIINSWNDFWYPSYVPENMEIKYFDEEEHLINYSSKTDDSFLIIEEFDLDTGISYDTDTTEGKIVEVGDTDGYYFEDNTYKNYGILINMADRYVSITCSGDWSEEEVMKIAENLVYIEGSQDNRKE